MKTCLTLIFLSFIFISVCSEPHLESKAKRNDYFITLRDGTAIDCTDYIPFGLNDEKTPCIIFCHGFGGSKEDAAVYAEFSSREGYYTFCYSMRGQGKSGGQSGFISRTEMNDLIEIIAYIKGTGKADTGRIAISGSSQGGIIPLMASAFGANVQCIVSDLAAPDFASNWIENGCVKMSLLWSLSYNQDIVRYSPEVRKYRNWILSKNTDKWDSLIYFFPKGRDFVHELKNITVPVMISNAWQDNFFNTSGIIKYQGLINSPSRYYFGVFGGHGSDTVFEESVYHNDNISSWLQYWLNDLPNGVLDSAKFTYASGSNPVNYNHWSYTRSQSNYWPPAGLQQSKFYLQPGQKLGLNQTGKADTVGFLNDVKDSKLKIQEAVNYNFTGQAFGLKFLKNYIYFESEPFDDDIIMTGIPEAHLTYSSDADICQFNFQVWEVVPDGQMNFVTRINYTDRKYESGNVKSKVIYGKAVSHIFRKGNRLRVYVTNLDNGPFNSFLGTNPFVLPVLQRARNIIYMNGKNGSYLELPMGKN